MPSGNALVAALASSLPVCGAGPPCTSGAHARNWTELGVERVGVVQGLLATCQLPGVDPYTYLVDVLQRVGDLPAARTVQLKPRLWKMLFADVPPRSDLDRARDPPGT